MHHFDVYGWYTSTPIAGRSTDIAPTNASETTTPGALRANFTGYAWQDLPYVTPPAPVPMPEPVPAAVTRRQATRALILAEKIDLVQPAIDAIPDPIQRKLMQADWDDSQEFQRYQPTLLALGAAIGLTSEGIDDLFRLAATQ